MPEPILNISDLNAFYAKSHVLQGVGLTVEPGELVVVVGRNGMGKTTLLRSVLAFPPVRRTGSIIFAGREIISLASHDIAVLGIGYVPQGRLLFPSLSVEEHLRLAGSKQPKDSPWSMGAIFELFPEIARRAKVGGGRLSGGEQQMLAVARALMSNPSLLMMDEPSEGLSQAVIRRIEEICRRLISAGMAILLVEQNLEMAQTLADRAYVFLNGQVALEESGDDFRADREKVGAYLGV
ncbi:MAG: ABC transporter ATP-binding protein [Desulfobacteraceae bacterium]|nr:MAG: ABC transporter ATP-binding protein [Desulfobacteraceae bacterium]